MKKILIALAGVTMLLTACNGSDDKENTEKNSSAKIENEDDRALAYEGSWNDDNTIYTTFYGCKLSKDEYNKLMKKTQDKDFIDLATEDMIDFYLLRTDFYRTDMLKLYMQDIKFSDNITYSDFYSETAKGNFHDYKIIAKATLDDNAYAEMKTTYETARKLSSVEDFNSLLSEEDKEKVGATKDFTVYGGREMMGLKVDENTKETAEGISVALFNDTTKEMIIYYYNPLFEEDMVEKTETADMKFDESKVKSVVIADGNTGDRVELEEADMKEILQKLNDMEFVNIDSEAYTGWTYSIKITYEDGSVTDITITGNEKIKCVKGNDVKYYKTEEDIIKLVDNYYKEQ